MSPMTTKEKNTLVRSALKFVNAIRKATGRKPLVKMPKGDRGEVGTCPIASGINTKYDATVSGDTFGLTGISVSQSEKILAALKKDFKLDAGSESADVAVGGNSYEFEAPSFVDEFVSEFDEGNIPELDNDPVSDEEE